MKFQFPGVRWRQVGALILGVIASISMLVNAQTLPAEVTSGVQWLASQIQAGGEVQGEAASTSGTVAQIRSEVHDTLTQLKQAVPQPLRDLLSQPGEARTEYLARRALQLGLADAPDAQLLQSLASRQNSDGGFGDLPQNASTPLDTAFALLAYAKSGTLDSAKAQAAFGYLTLTQKSTGGWGAGRAAHVYDTAIVSMALNQWANQYSVSAILAPAKTWLLGQRSNNHYSTTLHDALALLALNPQTADASVLDPLVSALQSSQASDGSWEQDPYLTALAVRALWSVKQVPPVPTTGEIQGSVVDAVSAQPLVGVVVKLLELPNQAQQTQAGGAFALTGVIAGDYTLQVSRLGYETRQLSLKVQAGQVLSTGAILLKPQSLTASLTGTVKNASGTAIKDAIVSVGAASVLTDATGAYALSGLNPGASSIGVTKVGYSQVNVPITFEAGKTYAFSPTLYAVGATPTTATLRGRIVDAVSRLAVAGAQVSLGSVSQTTVATGSFDFANQQAGSFSLNISAPGYLGLTASGTLVNGINNVGDIALTKAPTTSTIFGSVTDAVNGSIVAAARVEVLGMGVSAQSDAAGLYRIEGLQGAGFAVQASATGYQTQSYNVTLPSVGESRVDLKLVKPQPSPVSIEGIRTSKPVYAPNEELAIDFSVVNSSTLAVDALVAAQVFDQQGQVSFELKANATGLGANPPNLPVSLAASGSKEIELEKIFNRQGAGTYSALVQVRSTNGQVLAEKNVAFEVSSQAILSGGVLLDPPLVQAGTQTPVGIKADLFNYGNQPIPAGDVRLKVTLENADADVSTTTRAVVSPFTSGGQLTSVVGMARDSSGNLFVMNTGSDGRIVKVAPDGTQSLYFTLPTNTAPTDIDIDAQNTLWISSSTGGKVLKLTPSLELTTRPVTGLLNISALKADTDGSLLLAGTASDGVSKFLRKASDGSETMLWSGGLRTPMGVVKATDGSWVVSNNGDGTLVRVNAQTGAITPFVSGLNRPSALAQGPDGNFYVASVGDSTIVQITSSGQRSVYASALSQPAGLAFDNAGNLFVSTQSDNSIYKVAAGTRSVSLFARGVAYLPWGMDYDTQGNLYIANAGNGSLTALGSTGEVKVLSTSVGAPRGVVAVGVDDVLVADAGGQQILRVTAAGKTTLVNQLSGPDALALDGNTVLVGETSVPRIRSFSLADGSALSSMETLVKAPSNAQPGPSGSVFLINSGYVTQVMADGTARIFYRGNLTSLVYDPSFNGLWGVYGRDILKIDSQGVAQKLVTLPFANITGVALTADGNPVVGDSAGKRVVSVNAQTAEITALATWGTTNPSALFGTSNGAIYARYNYQIQRLDSGGVWADMLPATNTTYLYGAGVSDSGELNYSTYYNFYRVDPATGAGVLLKANTNSYWAVVSGGVFYYYLDSQWAGFSTANGSRVSSLAEFSGVTDIQVMPDSTVRFTDNANRLFTWTRGSYPQKLANQGGYLSTLNGDLYIANGATLYKWTGTAASTLGSLASVNARGFALNPVTNQLAVADSTRSSVVVLQGATNTVSKRYAGIYGPQGLAFDGQNRLMVSSYSTGALVRFEDVALANSAPTYVASISSPQALSYDAATNTLFIAASTNLYKMIGDAAPTSLVSLPGMNAIQALDGASVLYTDTSYSMVKTWSAAGGIKVLASGLSNPTAIANAPNGGYYLTNLQNGTLVAYDNGALRPVAAGLPTPNSMLVGANGAVLIGGTTGQLVQVDPATGGQQDVPVAQLLGSGAPNVTVAGLSSGATGKVSLLYSSPTAAANGIVQLEMLQPQTPPAAGTVVLERSASIGGLLPSEVPVQADFGTWVPPYSGDFKFEVTSGDANGAAHNFLHVGSFAQGKLLSSVTELPAGDQSLALTLNLKGADFTSISRVDTALVRPLVSNERPSGMVGDKAGNVWYTTTNSLKMTTPAGQVSTVVSGLTTAFGLAVDSKERFFLPTKVSGSTTYKLMMVKADGTSSIVADLGVTSANGIAVNSRDEILVGSPGRMLKVDADTGTVTTFTTQGLPAPRGLAIDGQDNVYVQNESHIVTMITPAGTASVLYNKGDGVEHPQFEGDGYPNIAADCADNFYIAPYQWSKIEQSGEEHILAQVVPRTGRAASLFNGLQISSRLSDIDYLAYDRFGSRILMWSDYVNEIWQAPVTCGAIGVEAHVISKVGQTLTGFDRAPNASIVLPDGRTEYVWSLRDVSSNGLNIGFDTVLKGLALGQQVRVADSGYLLFKNTFAANDVKVPLDIPVISVGNVVNATVTPDKPAYAAGEVSRLSTQLENTNARTIAGPLSVDVYDAAGVLLGNVLNQSVSLGDGETLMVSGDFAIGATVPGVYTVISRLSENGVLVAQAKGVFTVSGETLAAAAKSTLRLDKSQYAASETVRISSRVNNVTLNMPLDGLKLKLRVLDAAGALIKEVVYAVPQLSAGNTQAFPTDLPLAGAAPGTYKVVQELLSAAGVVIDVHEAPFEVLTVASTGVGLSGKIAAAPDAVEPGASVVLSYSVVNNGNATLIDLPLVVRVVNPATGVQMAEFPFATTMAVGATHAGSQNWVTQGQVGDVLIAVLSARLPAGDQVLAKTQFNLRKPQANVDLHWTVPSHPRVLILSACSQAKESDSHEEDEGHDGHGGSRREGSIDRTYRAAHHPVKHRACGSQCVSCDQTSTPQCGLARAQTIDAMLNGMGVEHRVTTDPSVFRSEMRTGAYNVYWLSGDMQSLDKNLLLELREGVRSGGGLLMDGMSSLTNDVLSEMAGAKVLGRLPYRNPTVDLAAEVFEGGQLAIGGTASYLALDDARELGAVNVSKRRNSVLGGNQFGLGQSVTFAFDVVLSQLVQPAWQVALGKALKHVTPVPAVTSAYAPGAWVSLQLKVSNLGEATDAGVKLSLPAGVVLESANPESLPLDAGMPDVRQWLIPMTSASETSVQLGLRLPELAGAYTLGAEPGYWQDSVLKLLGTPSNYAFTVDVSAIDVDNLQTQLSALQVNHKQQKALMYARMYLQQAETAMATNRWDLVIDALLMTNQSLSSLDSSQADAAMLSVARILKYAQWKWTEAQ